MPDKSPDKFPDRPPATKAAARARRSKAARPELKPLDAHLAELLNPALARGTAAPGTAASDRTSPRGKADGAAGGGFGERPQAGYDAPSKGAAGRKGARALPGFDETQDADEADDADGDDSLTAAS